MGLAQETVMMAHGSGGTMMRRIIEEVFLDAYGDEQLKASDDAAVLPAPSTGRIAMSTDTFVVTPHFFNGGDIGRLAICGTVNDVATSGAQVRYISCGFVLEEGFGIDSLRRICKTMASTCEEAGVAIVTGDTKVVNKGACDGVYINTTGVGYVPDGVSLSSRNIRPGDVVLLSGAIGDHGIAVISTREGLGFETSVASDAAPLNHLIANVLAAAPHVRCFRDPTRGGLASTLNEFAEASGVAILVEEESVPVHDQVRGACDMLGYDVYQVANEGKMVCVVPSQEAQAALDAMRASRYGEEAALIGVVQEGAKVRVRNSFGATRIMDMLVGEQLPRIC